MFKSYRVFWAWIATLALCSLAMIVLAAWALLALNLVLIAALGVTQLAWQQGWLRLRRVYWRSRLDQIALARGQALAELDDAIARHDGHTMVNARYWLAELDDARLDATAMIAQISKQLEPGRMPRAVTS